MVRPFFPARPAAAQVAPGRDTALTLSMTPVPAPVAAPASSASASWMLQAGPWANAQDPDWVWPQRDLGARAPSSGETYFYGLVNPYVPGGTAPTWQITVDGQHIEAEGNGYWLRVIVAIEASGTVTAIATVAGQALPPLTLTIRGGEF